MDCVKQQRWQICLIQDLLNSPSTESSFNQALHIPSPSPVSPSTIETHFGSPSWDQDTFSLPPPADQKPTLSSPSSKEDVLLSLIFNSSLSVMILVVFKPSTRGVASKTFNTLWPLIPSLHLHKRLKSSSLKMRNVLIFKTTVNVLPPSSSILFPFKRLNPRSSPPSTVLLFLFATLEAPFLSTLTGIKSKEREPFFAPPLVRVVSTPSSPSPTERIVTISSVQHSTMMVIHQVDDALNLIINWPISTVLLSTLLSLPLSTFALHPISFTLS